MYEIERVMVIEIHLPDENDKNRHRDSAAEDYYYYFHSDIDDEADDELGYFGIVIKKPNPPPCPYNKNGLYIPRNQRR